jgi:hypothetical protein
MDAVLAGLNKQLADMQDISAKLKGYEARYGVQDIEKKLERLKAFEDKYGVEEKEEEVEEVGYSYYDG